LFQGKFYLRFCLIIILAIFHSRAQMDGQVKSYTPRLAPASVVDGKIYVIGGWDAILMS
jgi:hypothetical protein